MLTWILVILLVLIHFLVKLNKTHDYYIYFVHLLFISTSIKKKIEVLRFQKAGKYFDDWSITYIPDGICNYKEDLEKSLKSKCLTKTWILNIKLQVTCISNWYNKFRLNILDWEISPHLLPSIGLYKYTCGVVGCESSPSILMAAMECIQGLKRRRVNKKCISPDPSPPLPYIKKFAYQ